MASFTPDLERLQELYEQYGADLFALCYLQGGRPAPTLDLMAAALCDMAASPKLWKLATSSREGFLRVGYLNCVDASLRRPKRRKKKKGAPLEDAPRAVLPFSMTDPLRQILKLRLHLSAALFCRERLGLSPQEAGKLLGTSPARADRLADTALKKAGITQVQARANLESLAPGADNLQKVWQEFFSQQGQGGFAARQRFRRFRRAMDSAVIYIAVGVVALCVVAFLGVEQGWFGQSYLPSQEIEGTSSTADVPQWVGDISVFVPEGEGFVEYTVHKTPGDPEQVLRQMVLLGGAPAGTTLLSWDYNTGGVESSDGSAATITLGEEAALTVELSKDALSLSGEEGVAMLRAMVATFTAYQKDVDTLSIRCEGQELTVEGHTAQDFLGQGLNITRTAETDYRE